MTKPDLGSVVHLDGVAWVVVTADHVLTPYRKRDQDTRVERWTLGLERAGGPRGE